MRVDTSLLDGITAANRAAKASSANLKSAGTTTSFSSALKSAEDKETTKAVPGTNYHEILTGPRAGMYLNKSGNARDGEAFILVKHDGREDHIYGTGSDRKVISSGAEKASGTDAADDTAETTSSTSDKAAADERTKPVAGHAYADILNGPRSGLFINTSGNARDGDAFVLVKRKDREYHIYGSGKDREVFSVKRSTEPKTSTDTTPATTPTTTTGTTTGTTPTGPLVTDSLT